MTTHTLFALDSMDSGTGRKVEIDGLEVLLVRIDDDIYAISDTCSQNRSALLSRTSKTSTMGIASKIKMNSLSTRERS